MTEKKLIDVVEHVSIMSKEFDKVISLTYSLNNLSNEEISLGNITQNINDFVLQIENVTKVYSLNEHKVVEYLQAKNILIIGGLIV